jgi:hypothetical protein
MNLEAGEPPQRAGIFTVRVSFTPTPDNKFTVNSDLHMRCVQIPRQSIKDTLSFALRDDWPGGNKTRTAELMNLATPKGHELTLRSTLVEQAVVSTYVKRICPLEPESKFVAVTKKDIWRIPPPYSGAHPRVWQLLVAFTRRGELHFLRLEATNGQVLETRELSAPQETETGQKEPDKKRKPG